MKKNRSPWIHQLRKDRQSTTLHADIETDVAVIGAGIAGVSTAFFILKYTDKKVTMVDRFKLAHGATGHNAGQVVSYFERGFASLVEEFGLELARDGQRAVESAWELIDEMYTDAHLNIPFSRFLGHAGLSTSDQVIFNLKNNYYRREAGLYAEQILIADDADFLHNISDEYDGLYTTVPKKEILSKLETESTDFIAVLSDQKGCVNSALFCEEVVLYLLQKFPDRFSLYEHTTINKVVLKKDEAILDAGICTITTHRVVFCTNGFESITILNESGLDIDTKFHHLVSGTVGYMSGYLEKMNKSPIAISYFNSDQTPTDPYFYLTRRAYEMEANNHHNIISIGGPELDLDDSNLYSFDTNFPDEMAEKIDEFVKRVYDTDPNKKVEYEFTWHGLMGYTKNYVRLIGVEPKNPVLMYNLGCNGIGILPSIYGGRRIANLVAGNDLHPSIFDVPEK